MPKRRNGRIDQINITDLDTVSMFGDKTGAIPYASYAATGFEKSSEHYRAYIDEFQFHDLGHVVDLGGAIGRWAVFLAEVNEKVTVVDHHSYLVDLGPRLVEYLGFDNIDFHQGSVEDVPFPNNNFDAAWMHGLIFLVDRDRALSEIRRLVRPGGRVFMGAYNAVGKMLQKMCHGYEQGGFENHRCQQGIKALKMGPMFPGPPNYSMRATLDETFGAHGMKIEYEYPVHDFSAENHTLSEDEESLFADTKIMAERFEADPTFRDDLIQRHKYLMRAVEFDLWFSAKVTG